MPNNKRYLYVVILILVVSGSALILDHGLFSPMHHHSSNLNSRVQNQPVEDGLSTDKSDNLLALENKLKQQDGQIDDKLADDYLAYLNLFETRDRLHQFVQDAASLSDAEKAEQSAELADEFAALQQAQKITQSEYLMLQIALLRVSTDSEIARLKSQQLIEQYKQLADVRNAAFINNPSPEFTDYKSREKAIVAEIMAMSEYPDGMSRDEYLAKRLAEARQAAYQSKKEPPI